MAFLVDIAGHWELSLWQENSLLGKPPSLKEEMSNRGCCLEEMWHLKLV